MINKVCFTIDNCCDCQHSHIDKIYTPDSFDHEEGIYCLKANNELIASDDWNIRNKASIPGWCPLLNK